MNHYKKIFIAIFLITSIFALGSQAKVVQLSVTENEKQISLQFSVNKGYGIQKEGPHEIAIYKLDENHFKSTEISEKIAKYGKKLTTISPVKFSGVIASEDEHYYSNVLPINLTASKNSTLAIRARIFFCSFQDNFCSVETVHQIIN